MTEERIYVAEIQKILHYIDRRSVRKWCHNHLVRILSDLGSNKQFVIKDEFERATNMIHQTSYRRDRKKYHTKNGEYIPKGEIEKMFLSTLQI
jgi:hypothetical protein